MTSESIERLHSLLDYDPETGVFRWKMKRGPRMAGDVAGSPSSKGYLRITVDGREHLAHRLAWAFVYGDWPINEIDHINQVKADNRIVNLRDVTSSENKQNAIAVNTNTSGFRGVYWANGAWVGQIKTGGKRVHLGRFDTPEAAHAAYVAARELLHPFAPLVS